MTIYSYRVLKSMKKVQLHPEDTVRINLCEKTIETASRDLSERRTISLVPKSWSCHFAIAVEDLRQAGYITLLSADLSGNGDYQISSKGLYFKQYLLGSLAQFCVKSVLVPIVVTVATTLLLTFL